MDMDVDIGHRHGDADIDTHLPSYYHSLSTIKSHSKAFSLRCDSQGMAMAQWAVSSAASPAARPEKRWARGSPSTKWRVFMRESWEKNWYKAIKMEILMSCS